MAVKKKKTKQTAKKTTARKKRGRAAPARKPARVRLAAIEKLPLATFTEKA